MNSAKYEVVSLAESVWSIEMNMVRAFVVAGDTSALLIDTGAGGVNLRQAVLSVTNLPVRIVNTHSHFDHISGNASFEMQFAHPYEIGSMAKAGFHVNPVNDGNGFDLGGRMLVVVGLPGHSPGSIGLWDAEQGILFAGDTVSKNRPVFLSMEGASVEAYARSLERILSMEEAEDGGTVSRIFCSHGDVECDMETVRSLRELVELYSENRVKKQPIPAQYASMMGDNIGVVKNGNVSLLVT